MFVPGLTVISRAITSPVLFCSGVVCEEMGVKESVVAGVAWLCVSCCLPIKKTTRGIETRIIEPNPRVSSFLAEKSRI